MVCTISIQEHILSYLICFKLCHAYFVKLMFMTDVRISLGYIFHYSKRVWLLRYQT
jgi:hypothetical protein